MSAAKIFGLVAAASAMTAAAEPLRLQPSSQWVLDYAEDSCRLTRTFGEGSHQTILQLESSAPGNASMVAVGNDLYAPGAGVSPTARLLPLQEKGHPGTAARSATTGQPAIHWPTLALGQIIVVDGPLTEEQKKKALTAVISTDRPPPIDPVERATTKAKRKAFASNTRAIEIVAQRGPVILETGSLLKPIEMLDQCGRDHFRLWGIDPDLEDAIVRPAWASRPQRWFSPNDYPSYMLQSEKESQVVARLLIGADGRVTKCTALSHFKAPEFQQAVCNILKQRARYEPAELADGTKVPSYTIFRVIFRIAS